MTAFLLAQLWRKCYQCLCDWGFLFKPWQNWPTLPSWSWKHGFQIWSPRRVQGCWRETIWFCQQGKVAILVLQSSMPSFILFCKFYPFQNFAKFMDVYHSSTTGIFDRREGTNPFVGHLDVWLNGGLGGVPDLNANQHKSAVYFFASTILGQCA